MAQVLVLLSLYAVEHTSFHFGLGGRKRVLCLFDEGPGLCTACHSCVNINITSMSHLAFLTILIPTVLMGGYHSCHVAQLTVRTRQQSICCADISYMHASQNCRSQFLIAVSISMDRIRKSGKAGKHKFTTRNKMHNTIPNTE